MVQNETLTAPTADRGELAGRRVVLTGGSRGIGAGIARRPLAAGADVLATEFAPQGIRVNTITPDRASYITGANLVIDGGEQRRP